MVTWARVCGAGVGRWIATHHAVSAAGLPPQPIAIRLVLSSIPPPLEMACVGVYSSAEPSRQMQRLSASGR